MADAVVNISKSINKHRLNEGDQKNESLSIAFIRRRNISRYRDYEISTKHKQMILKASMYCIKDM